MKQTLAFKLLFGIALTLGSLPAAAQSPQPMPPQPMAALPAARRAGEHHRLVAARHADFAFALRRYLEACL